MYKLVALQYPMRVMLFLRITNTSIYKLVALQYPMRVMLFLRITNTSVCGICIQVIRKCTTDGARYSVSVKARTNKNLMQEGGLEAPARRLPSRTDRV